MQKIQLKTSKCSLKEVIGKEIHEVNWQEGIGEFAIRYDNFTMIPWLLPHWLGEKKIRVREICEWKSSSSFLTRAFDILKKDKKSRDSLTRTTGEELLKFLEIESTKLTKSLKNSPQDGELRSQLVSKTFERLNQKPTASLQQYRALLLQAVIANSFGEVSSDSLLLLRKIQDRYYLHAQRSCQERIARNQPREKDRPERKKEKEKTAALSMVHMKLMENEKKYLNTKLRKIEETAKNRKFVLRTSDFKKYAPNSKNSACIKNTLLANSWKAVQIMRCFPLLHDDAQAIADHVIRLDPKNPLGIFLKGYIAIAEADLLIQAFKAGYKSQSRLFQIQNILKTTIKYYEHALLLIDKDYCSANLNILAEYANTIFFMHNMGKMVKPVPALVLKKYVNNISFLLMNAFQHTESESIRQAILKMEQITVQSNGYNAVQAQSA
ncbi:MAG: hypothetical protein HQM13_08790 [SAR324 cluster bacterium]|nr:hypothetical protein [SAR324 cluster bacterium]